MAKKPSYEDGHLVVAAVRVLSHKQAKPPTPEEISRLLDLPPEFVRTLVVPLGELGILRVMESPFETRVELGDHALLEDLPKSADGPSIKDELDGFIKRKKEELAETERMFTVDEMDKRKQEKLAKMEEEIKRMKKTKYQPFPD
jgi:hypothetical protein